MIQEWKPKAYYFSFFFELRCALARLSINQLDNNRKTNLLMYTPLWQTPLARHYYLAGASEYFLKLVGLWSTNNMPAATISVELIAFAASILLRATHYAARLPSPHVSLHFPRSKRFFPIRKVRKRLGNIGKMFYLIVDIIRYKNGMPTLQAPFLGPSWLKLPRWGCWVGAVVSSQVISATDFLIEIIKKSVSQF